MNVPGFGEALTKRLLEWRQRHEARFVFNSADNEADRREIARIQALVEGKAAPLRATLSSGGQELETLLARCQRLFRLPDPVLSKIHERVEKARKDLEFLGLPEPQVSPQTPPPVRRTAASPNLSSTSTSSPPRGPSGPVHNPTRASVSPNCPRCGSGMRLRKASKGRNAGQNFWGCSRYPGCKGTRPI
ncbi:MAG: topoisomerase DNA-binding C4 zinc finger domain-containing protein [Pseudomonadales bacterium]